MLDMRCLLNWTDDLRMKLTVCLFILGKEKR